MRIENKYSRPLVLLLRDAGAEDHVLQQVVVPPNDELTETVTISYVDGGGAGEYSLSKLSFVFKDNMLCISEVGKHPVHERPAPLDDGGVVLLPFKKSHQYISIVLQDDHAQMELGL